MDRSDLLELHYIVPLSNISSICELGILSHEKAARLEHESVAMDVIQQRREAKQIPNGLRLHQYVNLYINARNMMMYKRRGDHLKLAVIRVSPAVLDLPDVVIADRNAACDYVRFQASPGGLSHIDRSAVYARSWNHADPIEKISHGQIMCAEVLVPYKVDVAYLEGVYVSCAEAQGKYMALSLPLVSVVNENVFF
ncbi:MAG: DUF4433 domain-containing protein, partial [candidate division Zixibacteria bacterium]|nr:DUF4433 domain-containing protein [candidate division Zixibacteria bacterium]